MVGVEQEACVAGEDRVPDDIRYSVLLIIRSTALKKVLIFIGWILL